MKITISEIEIVPVKPNKGLVAFASFVLNNSFYVGSVGVYTRPSDYRKYRLVYPSKLINGYETKLIYPISKEAGRIIEEKVGGKVAEIINSKSDEYVRYSNSFSS